MKNAMEIPLKNSDAMILGEMWNLQGRENVYAMS